MLELIIFLLMIMPGILLAIRGSTYIVDYTILVFVFNRGIRRVVDYCNGAFNPFSLISITPIIMLGLLFLGFVWNFGVLGPRPKQIFLLLFGAIFYGMCIGIVRNGAASIFQGSEYLATIGMMGYAAVCPADDKTADRWIKTAALAGVLAALYGWYQYYVIPDWDAFWVREVGFVGYLGKLEPTEMSVFSTFSERGICAAYMGLVAIPMLVSRRWKVGFGLPEAILVVSCIFLTMARSGIIAAVLGAVLFPVLSKGKSSGRIVIITVLACAVLFAVSSKIPGADRIVTRFESLLHVQEDDSFQGRVNNNLAWLLLVQNPIGFGIGSSGMSERISGQSEGISSDNGWIQVATALGVPGFLLFLGALTLLWRYF
ncbi:MAG TPA: O-antigen ligase family protein, partial [Chthoniobacterales bacterium]|nr:O-antigen ligase family protein [Chthoniobacterales bacterium]